MNSPFFIFVLRDKPKSLRSKAAQKRLQRELHEISRDIDLIDDGEKLWIQDSDPCGMQSSNSARAMYATATAALLRAAGRAQ